VYKRQGSVVATTETLDGDDFSRDQEVVCSITVSDDEESGSTVRSEPVTIQNTPPTLASVELDSATPRTNDTVGVTLGATSDADGDTVTFNLIWYVNSNQVSTDSTLDSTHFVKGDQIVAEVVPNDGTDDGAVLLSPPVNVVNTPPTAPSLVFDPTSPDETNDLFCVVDTEATDADSDAVTYTFTWTVDGSAFLGAATDTYAGDTVKAVDLTDGETWECTVTPNDGTDDGPSAAISVTIGA